MIVMDLDRTLLHSDESISDYTINTLNKLQTDGIKIVIATARPIREVERVIGQLRFDSYIYHNGAVVQFENNVISHIGICNSDEIVNSMLQDNSSLKISIEMNDRLYSNFNANQIWAKTEYIKTDDFKECSNNIAEKILMEVHNNININKYINDGLYLQVSECNVAMIMNKAASKINGIQLLANQYGIAIDEIVAFGDDYNDIDMIKECGLGIAVNNAYNDVRKIADDICECNEKDGVARYINDILYSGGYL